MRAKIKGEKGERYFGLTTGRISDRITENSRRGFNLAQFVIWTEELAGILDSTDNEGHSFLTRYAKIAAKPSEAVPFALILDPNPDPALLQTVPNESTNFDDQAINWRLIENEKDVELKETVFSFSENTTGEEWKYLLKIEHIEEEESQPIITTLLARYDYKKGALQFKKGDLTNIRVFYRNDVFSLEHFLNTRHDRYAITLKNLPLVYHNKQFFELDYSQAEAKFTTFFRSIPALQNVEFEKIPFKINSKTKSKLKDWPENSIFYQTLKNVIVHDNFGEIEFIYCDDPNREIADFIVASFSRKKIAFVHCKNGSGKRLSASAFHDLTSQASKNLVYLRTTRVPPNIKLWNHTALWEGTKIKKWILGIASIPENLDLWNKIKEEILNHPSGQAEIWLVMGNGLDINYIKTIVSTEKETQEVGPLIHLLDGLVANCAEAAVTLKVFGH